MSKYYYKHVNASGFSTFRHATIWGVFAELLNLLTGESLTVIRSGDSLEGKLLKQTNLYEKY